MARQIGDLPHALGESEALAQRFSGKRPAVFLDYDGTLAPIPGALLEPKKRSVAVHFRLVPQQQRPRVKKIVDTLLSEYPQELKVTPGKMVLEIQPKLDWDKGKAVLSLLKALDLNRDNV